MSIDIVTDCTHRDTTITRVAVTRAEPVNIDGVMVTPVAYYAYTKGDGKRVHRVSMYATSGLGESVRADITPGRVPHEVDEALYLRGVML